MRPDDLVDLQPTLRRIVRGNEDALQEANLRLLIAKEPIRKLSHYAARTAHRCCIDARKRDRQRRLVALPADASVFDPVPTPLESLIAAEEHGRLHSELARLTARQRAALENGGRAHNSNRFKAVRRLRRRLGVSGV